MANLSTHARQWLLLAEQVFDFSDLTATPSPVVLNLPQGAIFLRGFLQVETVFNGTTPTVSIGGNAGAAVYLAATSIGALGSTSITLSQGIKPAGDKIIITPNAGAIASTAGQARLIIEYIIAGRSTEVNY